MQIKKLFILAISFTLGSCSTLPFKQQVAEEAIFYGLGIDPGHSKGQCNLIRSRCDKVGYSQWENNDGETHCSCKEN
ncbi:hypothetical protein [Paraglaciecola mesophila]|uniref:hypothetical protein n=1 Tax=Paraglaciecola mesophila TaxID=197222 RepID=UPI000587B6C1|nr:hypothetical protein [Paraglaciecola mesophila]